MEVRVSICCCGLGAGSFPAAICQEGFANHAMVRRKIRYVCCRGLDTGSFSVERVTPTPTGEWRNEKKRCARSGSLRRGNWRRLIRAALVPLPATETRATLCKSVCVSIRTYDHQPWRVRGSVVDFREESFHNENGDLEARCRSQVSRRAFSGRTSGDASKLR
jgi:hypothetical protein